MQTYKIKTPFKHQGRWTIADSHVELLDCEAEQLLKTGHIELIVPKNSPKKEDK